VRPASGGIKSDGASRGAHAAQALALRERLRCASDTITLAQTLITDFMGYSKSRAVNRNNDMIVFYCARAGFRHFSSF
jgi:hypothetical protein